jgi:hypothetical protein
MNSSLPPRTHIYLQELLPYLQELLPYLQELLGYPSGTPRFRNSLVTMLTFGNSYLISKNPFLTSSSLPQRHLPNLHPHHQKLLPLLQELILTSRNSSLPPGTHPYLQELFAYRQELFFKSGTPS